MPYETPILEITNFDIRAVGVSGTGNDRPITPDLDGVL